MARFYQKFLRKHISLATLGAEQNSDNMAYFCTPKGACIIGSAGVDGIHYCFIHGFGEMVFAVNPSNANPDYVHPLANNFEEFLRLLLACGSADSLEQAWMWDKEQFNNYIQENTPTADGQAVLSEIASKLSLVPIENPWQYIKELQNTFDYSKIKYTEDFYDPDMNGNIEPALPEWKVYYDGNFWGHHSRKRAGKEIPINKSFHWAEHYWMIPSVYLCSQGLVVDFCMQVDNKKASDFMAKWKFTDENDIHSHFTQEERMLMDFENPTSLDFYPKLTVNGKKIEMKHGCAINYNPIDTEHGNNLEGEWATKHYGLDLTVGWMIYRYAFPWSSNVLKMKSLSLSMEQDKTSIPVAHFSANKVSDRIDFINPKTKENHTLTVIDYEEQELQKDSFKNETMDFPTHFQAMNYTIAPPVLDFELSVSDCAESDQPRKKELPNASNKLREKYHLLPSARSDVAVGIIGGSCATMVFGHSNQGKIHCTCSSLHFEPVDAVEWMVIFHQKQFDDVEIPLIET